jgi:hypothetical protein
MKKIVLICLGMLIGTVLQAQSTTNNAYADNQVEVEPGVFAIYSGDINQDGFIDPFDYSILQSDILSFAFGYVDADLNRDGYVDPYDYSIYQKNSLNFVSSIHP